MLTSSLNHLRCLLSRIYQCIALSVALVLVCPPPFLLAAMTSTGPDWWPEQGVLASSAAADDYAAINQGQLKNLATKAAQAMEARLSGGAGSAVWSMINGWSTLQNGVRKPIPGGLTDDYATVTLGQLKTVAKPFYDRLISSGAVVGYPWAGTWSPDDYAVANIGQAKLLFSFAFSETAFPLGAWHGDSLTIPAVDVWYASREGASYKATGSLLDLGHRGTRAWLQFDERVNQPLVTYVSFNLRESIWNQWNGVPMGPYVFFRFNGITLAGGDGFFVSDGSGDIKEVLDAPKVMKPRGAPRANEWDGPPVVDGQVFMVRIDNVGKTYSVYIDQKLVVADLSFTPAANPRLEFLSPPELSLEQGVQVGDIRVLNNPAPLPPMSGDVGPVVLAPVGRTLFSDNFDKTGWKGLSGNQPLQQINGWDVTNINNGSGMYYVSQSWVAGFSQDSSRLARQVSIPSESRIVTLQFWIKLDAKAGLLQPFVSFNGVDLALYSQKFHIKSPSGEWTIVPVDPTLWAYNDTANGNRKTYGFDRITIRYDQKGKIYSLYLNEQLLISGQPYVPAGKESTLVFAGRRDYYCVDDVSLVQRSVVDSQNEWDLDSDGDGIPDYWEYILGSDPNTPDADGKAEGTDKTYQERYDELVNGRPDPASPAMTKPTFYILTPTL